MRSGFFKNSDETRKLGLIDPRIVFDMGQQFGSYAEQLSQTESEVSANLQKTSRSHLFNRKIKDLI